MSSDASSASSLASSSTMQTPGSGNTDGRTSTPAIVNPSPLPTTSASEGRSSAGTGLRPMVNMRSSLVATINNLKPTPRDVISGIAPHVFDERSKRRKTSSLSSSSRQANRSPHSAPRVYAQHRSGSLKNLDGGRGLCARTTPSSPLRFSVVSWDDGSIIIEQTGRHKEPTTPTTHAQSSSSLSSLSPSASFNPLRRVSSRADAPLASPSPSLSSAQTPSRPSGLAKDTPLPPVNRSKWRSLRVDAHVFRTFVIKFRSSSRTNS